MIRTVVFSHGKESGPWGTKIVALAAVARELGFPVASIDYQGIDDPSERVARLIAEAAAFGPRPVLVGSSMGGHVATAAALALDASALFLMAPAFDMPGYEHLTPSPNQSPVQVVHGWHDEVVPVENSIRWARRFSATLHLLDTDHRMTDRLHDLCDLFKTMLAPLAAEEAQ
jgi:pimeloyl-ACP methyl ester carboxylesterase